MLWLWRLLEKSWKDVSYFAPDKPSKIFNFLKWSDKIKDEFDYWYYNLLIFVDFSDYSRLWKIYKNKGKYFKNNSILIIDHHESENDETNQIVINDTKATSTCEIIFEQTIKIREKYFDEDVATYLYLWLTTDSWNFRYDQNHERILKNALDLIKLWANKKLIIDNLINNKSMWTINFLKLFLERLKEKWNILYTYYDKEEFNQYWIDNEQAWYWLTIIQEIKWPKVIMTIRKEGEIIKYSLRSKDTNVEKIAKEFLWWWHKYAAWFSTNYSGNFQDDISKTIQKINSLLDE